MAHKCYISFKREDERFKDELLNLPKLDIIDKSLHVAIDSNDEDYILQTIRDDYLSDSTVTIHLIGLYGAEARGWNEQRYIKRELQASLRDSERSPRNGILGIVLPDAYDTIFGGTYVCSSCGHSHNLVAIKDSTTIAEFRYNYYIPNNRCSHTEDERYCVLVKWDDFIKDPEAWINSAFAKRNHDIAKKVRVYPK